MTVVADQLAILFVVYPEEEHDANVIVNDALS